MWRRGAACPMFHWACGHGRPLAGKKGAVAAPLEIVMIRFALIITFWFSRNFKSLLPDTLHLLKINVICICGRGSALDQAGGTLRAPYT